MWKSFLFLFILFVFPTITYANGAGLPAFFKINDQTAIANPLQTFGITAQSFLIPQDYAPEKYEVNKPIHFSIDKKVLQTVITPEFLQNTTFMWDFGDGTKADGYENTHTYTKKGTYILVLTINVSVNPGDPPTQFIDSYLINVLPDQHYKGLPQAVIKVNGEQVTSNTKKLVNANFADEISFDATDSKSSAPIVAYLWNFGDGQTSTSPKVTHTYKDQYFDTVVLRVRDKNGFFSDSFIGLKDDKAIRANSHPSSIFLFIILGIAILVGAIVTLLIRKKRK
jgi:hypothetical protein